ncbi:hypothetical protein TWF225_005214 [Orbilia oligospora]|uniref:Uncharacterized protein n=1 Tax=Orbilia oligospora TaxID=2813651 RepID=A0A7C8PEA9_ORBOL|nr:hypothetical protein TWF751_005747 [Orbilia oligospora]KAF3185428.1 hypothetical protein TWF225_005214 [Orbilia oligospora]KAF3252416.1 hypothetical protein TWF128_006776 [Orbilia oligospora]KAF3252417.1 hypothetical protein TWF128_006776 [Orbilia oligospora]KAF3258120.1 hypothetical protein TWF217_005817 [Orbilia oligospora]
MSSGNQKFNEFVPPQAEAGPSTSSALPPTEIEGGGGVDLEAPKEEKVSPFKESDAQIAAAFEKSEELPSYTDLVRTGEVRNPDDGLVNLNYISVDIQLAKFCGEVAIKQFNEYKARGAHLPINYFMEQALNVVKILAVIRVILVELRLTEDTYIYLQTAAEYLGCQMLVRYAILKKNPEYFRDSEGNWQTIQVCRASYLKLWLQLAKMLTNPEFTPLPKEAKAAKIDIPNGEFHLLIFKLIDPSYSYHVGRRFSRFVDKAFGTPKKKECTSGLCNLSPEAQKAIRFYCTCEVSKYQKKKAERAAGQEQPPSFTADPPSVRPS